METKKDPIIYTQHTIEGLIKKVCLEIRRHHEKLDDIVLIGILNKGWPLANRISNFFKTNHNTQIPVGSLDVTIYRDDLPSRNNFVTLKKTEIPANLTNKKVILIDDVLFHGRTTRAALNGLMDFGRPKSIELAVLFDRGDAFRELPIYARFLGKKIHLNPEEYINMKFLEIDGEDGIELLIN